MGCVCPRMTSLAGAAWWQFELEGAGAVHREFCTCMRERKWVILEVRLEIGDCPLLLILLLGARQGGVY